VLPFVHAIRADETSLTAGSVIAALSPEQCVSAPAGSCEGTAM